MPPACMIHPATVGIVKYPMIPIIINRIYAVLLPSISTFGLFVSSEMSFCNISTCILASIVENRSATGSQRYVWIYRHIHWSMGSYNRAVNNTAMQAGSAAGSVGGAVAGNVAGRVGKLLK